MSATKTEFENSFYVTGGTLDRDAACYIVRAADQQLYDGLRWGQFCYVLTARQMGKSSLMVRAAARLRDDGVRVAVLDLTTHGQNLTAEQKPTTNATMTWSTSSPIRFPAVCVQTRGSRSCFGA